MADFTATYGSPDVLTMYFVDGSGDPVAMDPAAYLAVVREYTTGDGSGVLLTVNSFGVGPGSNGIRFQATYDSDGSKLPLGTYDIRGEYRESPRGASTYAPLQNGTYYTLEVAPRRVRKSREYIPWVRKRMDAITHNRRTQG